MKINYPLIFIGSCIKLLLNKLYTSKVIVQNVPKRNLFAKFLFLGSTPLQYSPSYEDFSILTKESNDFKLKIMESLLIASDKLCLNKADSSLPLEVF